MTAGDCVSWWCRLCDYRIQAASTQAWHACPALGGRRASLTPERTP